MNLPSLSLFDRINVIRTLIFVAAIMIPLNGVFINIYHPELFDPIEFRLGIALPGVLLFILSFKVSFVKKHFEKFFYFLYLLLIGLLEFLLYKNNLDPEYAVSTFLVFIGMALGIANSIQLITFLLLFLSATLITIFNIPEPALSVYNFASELTVLAFLTYLVMDGFIKSQIRLKVSTNNFKTLFNYADEIYFLFDKNFKVLQLNERGRNFIKVLFYKDIKEGDNVLDFLSGPEKEIFISNFIKALNGENRLIERKYKSDLSASRWFEIKFLPVKTEEAEIEMVLFSGFDITEKKNAEELLQESESRFRAMNDASPTGIFFTDPSGDCIYTNFAYQKITGLTYIQALGRGWSETIHPEDRNKSLKIWYDSAHEGKNFDCTQRFIKPDGTVVWTSVKASILKEGGTVLGYVGTVEDITELKKAGDALLKSEQQFRDLFEMAPIGMAMTSLDGQILKINKALIATLGYTEKEFLAMNFAEFIHPDDMKLNLQLHQKFLVKKLSHFQVEKRFLHKNSQTVNAILKVTLI